MTGGRDECPYSVELTALKIDTTISGQEEGSTIKPKKKTQKVVRNRGRGMQSDQINWNVTKYMLYTNHSGVADKLDVRLE